MSLFLISDKGLNSSSLLRSISRELNPVLNMNFTTEDYSKDGVPFLDMSDALDFTRDTVGTYNTKYQYIKNSGSINNRITNDPHNYVKGLLVESDVGNKFKHSSKASTQVVSLFSKGDAKGVGRIAYFRAFGDGEIIVKDIDTDEVYGTSKQGKAVALVLTEADKLRAYSFKIEVVGSPDFVEVFSNDSNRISISRVGNSANNTSIPAQQVKLKPNLLKQLLPDGVGCLVIKLQLPKTIIDLSLIEGKTTSIAHVGNGSNEGVTVGFRENYITPDGLEATAVLRTSPRPYVESIRAHTGEDLVNFAREHVYALNFSSKGSSLAYNGNFLGSINDDSANGATQMYIASSPKWSTNDTSVVQEIILLSENLTPEEMRDITKG